MNCTKSLCIVRPEKRVVESAWYRCSYLCTYDLYDPVRNVFDACKSITRASGSAWALEIETFWALWNGIEPLGECHLGPKKSVVGQYTALQFSNSHSLHRAGGKFSLNVHSTGGLLKVSFSQVRGIRKAASLRSAAYWLSLQSTS